MILILVFLVIIFARGVYGAVEKERESSKRVKELEVKTETLKNREVEIKESMARLGTEEGLREEIKNKFNVSEDGELFVVIVEPLKEINSTEATSTKWYKKWWNSVKNLLP
ncbi:MAG: septum formation initiator family protein [bacterium]